VKECQETQVKKVKNELKKGVFLKIWIDEKRQIN